MIYHIVGKDDWMRAEDNGIYKPDSLALEGFIHCSDINKIEFVANSFYKGVMNLVILEIDENRVPAEIKWEDLGDFNHDFPHIYGPLNLDAVLSVRDFTPDKDGYFEFPMN